MAPSMTWGSRPMAESTWLRWNTRSSVRPGGDADAPILETVENPLTSKPRQGTGRRYGARVPAPQELHARQLRQGSPAGVPELGQAGDFGGDIQGGTGRAEAHDGRHPLGAGTVAALLTAAQQQRRQLQSLFHIERAGALGSVDLVAGNGNQIGPQGLGLEGDLAEALDGVGVEEGQRALAADRPDHLGNGHHRAGLVVDHHHAGQNGVGPQGGGEGLQGNRAVGAGLEKGDLKALGLELFPWDGATAWCSTAVVTI